MHRKLTSPSDITSRSFPGFTFVISTTRRFFIENANTKYSISNWTSVLE